ncbi:MAG TPA: hypothetical protein VMP01_10970 [Pirellulaceae bacterium]|nr:hypothetical protein [Pirellulaceae bacterium]
MSTATSTSVGHSIYSDIIAAAETPLSEEGANWILSLRFPQAHVDRMLVLAERNNAGKLTSEEREEMDQYLHTGHVLSMLHALVRLARRHQE